MRALAVLLSVVALTAVASAGVGATAGPTQLRITLWPVGKAGPSSRSWTVRCAPPRGSLPNRRSACARLALLDAPFRPVPSHVGCLAIYGGQAVGLVRGFLHGARVYATFNLTDSCRIERWRRVAFLFPGLQIDDLG